VESFRNEDGQPRQRTVATLGRIDECGGQLDALLGGLLRAKGRPANSADAPQLRFESALALGDVWALDALWHELGFDGLGAVFRRARFTNPVEHALRVMAPGPLDLPSVRAAVPAEKLEKLVALIPVQKLGKPGFIAQQVVQLASPDADSCTGAAWDVNGGIFMR